jgi:hypothetical protein
MIGVGQGLLPGLGRGQLLAIPLQHTGQHAQPIPGFRRSGGGRLAGRPAVSLS